MVLEAPVRAIADKAGRGRILVVDDEKDFVLSLVDILESRGYTVEVAFSAAEARQKAAVFDSQVALLDVRLGRDSGIDLIPGLKAMNPALLPVMMTAYAATDTAIEALQEGAYDYLRKPLNAQDLLATLKRCFEKIQLEKEKLSAESALRERNQDLERVNSRLRKIVDSSRGFTTCSSMGQLGPLLLEEFAENMAAEGGSLFLVKDNGLVRVHALDPSHVPESIEFPLRENSPFRQAMEKGEAVLVGDIVQEEGVSPSGWGGYRNGSLLVFPIRDESGDNLGVVSLHNKVTPPFTPQDRELGMIMASYACETLRATQAIEALQKSEQRYRLLAENATDVIWTTKLDLEFTYISPSVERLRGFKPEEIIGKRAQHFMTADSSDRIMKAISRDLARDQDGNRELHHSIIMELELNCRDGSTCWAEVLASFLRDGKGVPVGIIGVSRDIGYRRELERQLLQAQKMESIGTLAGGIAHDFNNILAAILGYVEFSMLDIEEESQAWTDMGKVLKAGERAKDLVQQILAFSHGEKKERKPILIGPIVREALKLLRASLPATIEINQDIGEGLAFVEADPTQIHQVVMNLCTNAAHAMRLDGGVLEVKLSEVEVDSAKVSMYEDVNPGPHLLLNVSDSGHGIQEGIRDRIFDPYFTTKEIGEGTGLGLATVHGIVKNHRGFISAESQPGRGATFFVYLPLVAEEPDAEEAETTEPYSGGTERVLFVDDEESLVEVSRMMLEHLGYQVVTATSSTDALELFSSEPDAFDVVITDMTMPGLTGDLLTEEMRKIRPDIPVVICTGFSERLSLESVRERTARMTRLTFLLKPQTMGELARAVRKVLDS